MTSLEYEIDSEADEAEFPGIDVQVVDYYYINDGRSYDMHFYMIQVTNGRDKYVVDRSYVDFVILHRSLKKMYKGSQIMDLPMKGFPYIDSILQREVTNLADYKKKVLQDPYIMTTRASISDSLRRRDHRLQSSSGGVAAITTSSGIGGENSIDSLFPIPEENIEVIQALGQVLTLYLIELCCHPELLTSDDLHLFLDEEIADLLLPVLPPPLTTTDLVLINQSIRNTIVHRIEEFPLKVPSRHYVVWRFATTGFDIGFSMEVNGVIKIPLTRFKSHEAPICGALKVDHLAECLLRWDNSYAKLHSKQLTWSIRVISVQEYDNLHNQAMACLREKRRFESQRLSLRRSATIHASKLNGVILGSILEADYVTEQRFRLRRAERRVAKLTNQNELLLSDLEQVEVKIEDLERHRQALVDSKTLLSESWVFSNSQLEAAETQIQTLIQTMDAMQHEIEIKEETQQELLDQLNSCRSHVDQLQQALLAVVNNLQPKLQADKLTYMDYKRRMDTRTDAFKAISSESDSDESKQGLRTLSSDLMKDSQQLLAYVQHNQAVLQQICTILNRLALPTQVSSSIGNDENASISPSVTSRGTTVNSAATVSQDDVLTDF